MDNKRREFIKNSCTLCAGILGLSALLPTIQSCAPLHNLQVNLDNGKIKIPLSSFQEGSNVIVLKNPSFSYPLAVTKQKNGSYQTFELKCTHQDNPLGVSNSGFFCSTHGSNFDLKGKVLTPPASRNLREFKTELVGEQLDISFA